MYGDSPKYDWFHDYFENTYDAEADGVSINRVRISDSQETLLSDVYEPSMTIERAHFLFSKYCRVKQAVQSYVEAFVAREFANGAIGVHFRGTDKDYEATPVDWHKCFASVMKIAADRPELKKVFLSSDEARFIDWFSKEAKGTLSVISHADEERSPDGWPVHTNQRGNNRRKGFEAMVNCLLLSRCAFLVRSTSFLSGWSSIFNPALPITLLNEPFAHKCWFPDNELLRRSENRYR